MAKSWFDMVKEGHFYAIDEEGNVVDFGKARGWEAFENTSYLLENEYYDGTYEAMGPHFQGNPLNMRCDKLFPHGEDVIYELRGKDLTFDIIKEWLYEHAAEGIVWWKGRQPICKIKRTDFGFSWPYKKED